MNSTAAPAAAGSIGLPGSSTSSSCGSPNAEVAQQQQHQLSQPPQPSQEQQHQQPSQTQQQQPSSQQQRHQRQPLAASASEAAGDQSKLEYLEQKYGSRAGHVTLSRGEVEAMLDRVLQDSPTVLYLLQSLKQGGCGVGRPFFHVTRCADDVGGGFSTDYGVILCHNRLSTYKEVELAVAHELVHAYDFCRASNLDLTNCNHHACTEIRAASLSGDCGLAQEFVRGNLTEALVGQYKRCVRRRALLSVSLNPYCQGGKAEAAVAAMMTKCFKDTDPFPRVPGA